MSQYQPLQVFTESDSDDDWDEDESSFMERSVRPRKLCRCTKKRFICCGLLFALLLLVTAILGGVAAGVYYLTQHPSAGAAAGPAVSSSVSSSSGGQFHPPTSPPMTASSSSEQPPTPTFSTPTPATSETTSPTPVPSTTLSTSMTHSSASSSLLSSSSSLSVAVHSSPTAAVSFSSRSPASSPFVSSSSTSLTVSSSSSAYIYPVVSSSSTSFTVSSSSSAYIYPVVSSSSASFTVSSSSSAYIYPVVSSAVPSIVFHSSSASSSLSPPPSPTPSPPLFSSLIPTPTPSPTGPCSNDSEVCKGANNPLQYRVVTLPNDLRVLLISNNKTSTAGAAMDVRSGSFQDTTLGLAHFCEHMLFLGTKKYPEEGEYAKFLSSNGGSENAYTSHENTNYHFSVNSEKLEGALDRFSQFFIGPLFNEDAVNREINAVNSEYEKDKGIPGWHYLMLLRHVADPRSPFSRFNIGSKETLSVPGIHQQVVDYYNRRYSSNLMQLVVYGKQGIDQLESWAQKKFSNITNKKIHAPRRPNPAYPPGYSPRLIVYKLQTPTPLLSIVWQTPGRQDLYRYGVESFITVLVTSEGQGSLSHYLKITNPWATSVSFNEAADTSGFALFSVSVGLTEAGVANIEDVIAGVFGYIAMLKGREDEELYAVWLGRNKLDKIKFDYASPPSDIFTYVKNLANTMRTVEDPADFLSPPHRSIWNVNQVRSFLDYLTPDKSNIFFSNPSLVYDNETAYPSIHGDCTYPQAAHHDFNVSSADQIEPYFNTMYAIYCTDTRLIQKWDNPDIPGGTFDLPDFKTYVPRNLTLLPLPADHSTVPQLVHDDKQGYRVWWMQDYLFRDPVVIVKCQAYTGATAATAKAKALSMLYAQYVSELLTDVTDTAAAASYEVKLELLPSGIAVQFSGYSDPEVVMRFMEDVLQGALAVSEASLSAHNDTLYLAYQQAVNGLNGYKSSTLPYDYVVELSKLMLLDPRYLKTELLGELSKLTLDKLPATVSGHMDKVLKSVSRMECYATGNVDRDGAIIYSKKIVEKLTQKVTAGEGQEGDVRVVKVKQGTTALATKTLNPEGDANSAIMVVMEVGPICDVTADPKNGSSVTCSEESLKHSAFSNVLSLIISDACFSTLRTKEQLGYVVQCGAFPADNAVLNLYFLVQSLKAPPYLLDRINNFTDAFFTDAVLDARFYEAGLIAYKAILQAEDKSLQDQVDRLWTLIHNQHYNFDLKETLLTETEHVTHSDFVNFYDRFVLGDLDLHTSTSVRQLVVGAFSNTAVPLTFGDEVDEEYTSLREFKKTAEYWDL